MSNENLQCGQANFSYEEISEIVKLAAAAPDLLEALIEAKKQINHLKIILNIESMLDLPSTESTLIIIDNAINKATK